MQPNQATVGTPLTPEQQIDQMIAEQQVDQPSAPTHPPIVEPRTGIGISIPTESKQVPQEQLTPEQQIDQMIAQQSGPTESDAAILGQGVMKSAMETAPFLTLTAAGAKYGKLPGAIIGGISSLVASEYLTEKAAELDLIYDDAYSGVNAPQRQYALLGEQLGGAAPFLFAPYTGLLRNTGRTRVGEMVNKIVDFARKHPLRYMSVEGMGVAWVSSSVMVAEELYPGQEGVKMAVELGAGLSTAVPEMIFKFAKNRVFSLLANISQEMAENRAAATLMEILEDVGDDPEAILRILNDPDIFEGAQELTMAQLTGSDGLAALQKYISESNRKFGVETAKKADEFMLATATMINRLRATGDPALMHEAMKMQDKFVRDMVEARLASAAEEVQRLAMKIAAEPQSARPDISVAGRAIMDKAIEDMKPVMKKVWDDVPEVPAGTTHSVKKINELMPKLVETRIDHYIPPWIRNLLQQEPPKIKAGQENVWKIDDVAKPEPPEITSKKLVNLRSDILNEARIARVKGADKEAGVLEQIAGAILDDLNDAYVDGNEAYKIARKFTKDYHDVFSRSFVGKLVDEDRFGDKILPEELMKRAYATGPEARHVAFREMEDTLKFVMKHDPEQPGVLEDFLNLQGRYIRLVAAEAVDVNTKMISVERLTKFLQEPGNQKILEKFPEAKRLFQEAIDSQIGLAKLEADQKQMMYTNYAKETVSKFANGEPVTLLGEAIASDFPEKRLSEIIALVKDGGDVAVDGLRVSVLELAMQKAEIDGGKVNIEGFRKYLFKPVRPNTKSVMEVMTEKGVIDQDQVVLIDKWLTQAERVLKARTPGTAIDEIEDIPDLFIDALARISGAKMATKFASATGAVSGASLVIAGVGAKLSSKLLKDLPKRKQEAIFLQALTDKALMTRLLERNVSEQRMRENAAYIHSYLLSTGVYFGGEIVEGTMGDEEANMVGD